MSGRKPPPVRAGVARRECQPAGAVTPAMARSVTPLTGAHVSSSSLAILDYPTAGHGRRAGVHSLPGPSGAGGASMRRAWPHDRGLQHLPRRRRRDRRVTEAVAEAVRVVRESGLPNETNAMFTNIEGEWDEVMAVVKQAVDVVAAAAPRGSGWCSRPTSGPGTTASSPARSSGSSELLGEEGRRRRCGRWSSRSSAARPAVREVPEPVVGPRGVVVRVEATGLCRSDWHGWAGHDADIAPAARARPRAGRAVVEVGAERRRGGASATG